MDVAGGRSGHVEFVRYSAQRRNRPAFKRRSGASPWIAEAVGGSRSERGQGGGISQHYAVLVEDSAPQVTEGRRKSMSMITRPNSWVASETGTSIQLTYGLQVNPAPITVSIPNQNPVLASLEFV